MRFIRIVLAAAGTFAVATFAQAQNFPSGYVQANTAATAGPPKASSATSWFDRWCGSTSGYVLYRGASNWACGAPGATSGVQAYNALLAAIAGLTTAQHDLIVATGVSTVANKSLPDCTDTSGNHLNYTRSTQAFSCGSSSSGGSGIDDTVRRNILLNCANIAKALTAYQRVIDAMCDGYKSASDDGIKAASSSNYTTATGSGNVAPTTSLTRITGGTPTVPLGGTSANINDNNTGTTSTTSALGDLSGAALGSRIIAKIDYGSNKTVTKIEAKQLSNNTTTIGNHQFLYSTDGSSWTQLGANFTVTTTPTDFNVTGSVAARYVALAVPAVNFTTQTETLSDLNGYQNLPDNMTVVTTVQTADATVSNVRVLIEYDNTATPTLNTDLNVSVSCDNESHYASATFSSVGLGQAGRLVAETADTSCGANTGTQFSAKITTANNKSVPIHKTTVTAH